MAGEKAAWAGEGMLSWGGFWAPYARRLLTPWRPSVGLALSLFLLTLLAFHFTSQGHTPFNNPVRLADAVLHDRLDIANGAGPRVQHERIPGLTSG